MFQRGSGSLPLSPYALLACGSAGSLPRAVAGARVTKRPRDSPFDALALCTIPCSPSETCEGAQRDPTSASETLAVPRVTYMRRAGTALGSRKTKGPRA